MTLNLKTQRLIALMADHNVGIPDVAELVNRSEKTVRMWRSKNEPSIPDELLELLELKLAQRAGGKAA